MSGLAEDETLPSKPAEPVVAFAPDTRVGDGRYRIVRFIAAGAMGEVYEADDLVIGERIAIKALRDGVGGQAVQRLRREIALARKVTHANVCRVHDVGEHAGRPFVTMELLAGDTLADRIRKAPLAIDEIERIARQLVGGLGALHAAGIVHRDLKSSNIVCCGERVVLTDFGLARSVTLHGDGSLTAEGSLLGTPAYMAPEQVEGKEATFASDIYALGVVLYEMATGTTPFRGDTAMAIATARLTQTPPPPTEKRPELSTRWEATILRCLAREPEARNALTDIVPADVPAPRARRRWLVPVTLAVVLVTAGAVWLVARPGTSVVDLDVHTRALTHLRRFEHVAARNLLEPRLAEQPEDPWIHYLLGWATAALGERETAKKHLRIAFAKRATLGEADQLRVEVQQAMVAEDAAKALPIIDRLIALAPDDVDARLDRALVLDELGRRAEALSTLASLRAAAGANDPRVDLWEAAVIHDQARKRTLVERALVMAEEQRAPGLEGEAYVRLAWVNANLGDVVRGEREAEEARRRFAKLGDRKAGIHALNALSLTRFLQGKYRDSTAALETAIDLAPTEDPGWVLRCNYAIGLATIGDVRKARETIEGMPDTDDPMQFVCRGWIAELGGDLAGAQTVLERGRALTRGPSFASVFHGWRSGVVHARAGDLAAARRDLETAVGDASATGNLLLGAFAQVVLARVTLAEGNALGAESLARQALDELTRRSSSGSVGLAHAVIVEARLARGDRDGARTALAAAERVRGTLQDPTELAALDVAKAKLDR